MACSSGCPTPGAHSSYGACLRAKRLEIEDIQAHKFNSAQLRSQADYASARRAGIQPETVFQRDIDYAVRRSDQLGRPFRADKGDL